MTDPPAALAGQTCLVTGASGFLGSWVVAKLAERGARVRCLVRATSRRDFLDQPGIEFAAGDLSDRASLERAVAGASLVFHLAGLIKTPHLAEYDRVNRVGTLNVLDACLARGDRLARLVVVSSQAAAGPSSPGCPVDESASPHPITPYGQSKRAAEQAAEAYRDRLPLVIVRPPTIYGPRDRETLLLFRLAALGVRAKLGVAGAISAIHAADLADGILLSAVQPVALGQTYFLSGDESPPPGELMAMICEAVGRRGVGVPVPPRAVRLAGHAAEVFRDLTGVPLIFDRWKAEELATGYWECSNRRAKAELAFQPRVALRDGLAETARWYRNAGWL